VRVFFLYLYNIMSYTITKETTGKVLVESTTLPPNYLPSDALVKQTVDGIDVLNANYEKIAGFKPSEVTEVDDGATQTNPTTPTELFDALKTVFRKGGASSLSTAKIERLIDQQSTSLLQNPTGLGPSNAIQIEFGPAANGAEDPVMLGVDGTMTFNTAGTYRIKLAFQFGRLGNPGTSLLLFRVTGPGDVQLGRSVGFSSADEDETEYFENDTWLDVPAGLIVKAEIMRDAAGTNFGGLKAVTPTADGGNEWNMVPTAAIRVSRLI
jgi:hypothetical protein